MHAFRKVRNALVTEGKPMSTQAVGAFSSSPVLAQVFRAVSRCASPVRIHSETQSKLEGMVSSCPHA